MKKILRVPYTNVLRCLAPIDGFPLLVLPMNTIPPGSAILAVHENHQCRAFDFVIQHESFPETHPGCELPVILVDGEWVQVLPAKKKAKK